jgi:hypothetical protein
MSDPDLESTPIHDQLAKEYRARERLIEFFELFDLHNQAEREKHAPEQ